jgi:hypothetical protein
MAQVQQQTSSTSPSTPPASSDRLVPQQLHLLEARNEIHRAISLISMKISKLISVAEIFCYQFGKQGLVNFANLVPSQPQAYEQPAQQHQTETRISNWTSQLEQEQASIGLQTQGNTSFLNFSVNSSCSFRQQPLSISKKKSDKFPNVYIWQLVFPYMHLEGSQGGGGSPEISCKVHQTVSTKIAFYFLDSDLFKFY